MLYDAFTDEQREALVFAKAYQDCRKEYGQFGYAAFKSEEPDVIKASPVFKQFCTVAAFLKSKGWGIGWKHPQWKGYISFVFEKLKPTVPQPGQLKNEVLLKEYCAASADIVPVGRSAEELEALYKQVLHPDLANDLCLNLLSLRLSNANSAKRES